MARLVVTGLVVLLLAVAGCGGGGEEPERRAAPDPLGEALAYLPTQALAVGTVSTQLEAGQGGLLAARLARIPATQLLLGDASNVASEAGLSLDDLRAQAGNPVAIAVPDLVDVTGDRIPLAAWAVRDGGALRESLQGAVDRKRVEAAGEHRGVQLYRAQDGAPALALAGGILLLAKDTDTLKLAIDRHAQRRGLTRRDLADRLEGTPATAPVRLSISAPVALAGPRFAELRKIPWVAALERVTLAVGADEGSITAVARFDTSESDLIVGDLPVAGGAGAPAIPRFGALRIGLLAPGDTLLFAQEVWKALNPGGYRIFEAAQRPIQQAGVDPQLDLLDELVGPATLSTDLQDSKLRIGLRDPEGFADALTRSRFLLGPLLATLGVPGLQFTVAPDGATQVSVNALVVARLAVVNGQFVVTTKDPDLARVERAPRTREPGADGAFVVRMQSRRLRATAAKAVGLPERAGFALDGIGDGTLVVRSEPAGTTAVLRLDVR